MTVNADNKCWFTILKGDKTVKRYAGVVKLSGQQATYSFKTKSGKGKKTFKSIPGKPAIKVVMESIMLRYKDYDPQVHRVTLIPREKK